MKFEDLKLHKSLLKAVRKQNYTVPTPIQEKAIPIIISEHDVLGCSQTGTGKTAAFVLPVLQLMNKSNSEKKQRTQTRVLVLVPTRELATQIGDSFQVYGRYLTFKHTVIYGGVSQHQQVKSLKKGVDIIVATPGRLLDLMNQGYIDLNSIEYLILDEADRMLDMGFIHEIKRIVRATPQNRQTLLFSATLHPEIRNLAGGILRNPKTISITPVGKTLDKIKQSVCFVSKSDKIQLLIHILKDEDISRALIFSRTKHGADFIVRKLSKASISALAIHGNKSQRKREYALEAFKKGRCKALIATDVASRGLDVNNISHVLNFDLPEDAESYIHRIGRTGRADSKGVAISFCSIQEHQQLHAIQYLIKKKLDIETDKPFCSELWAPASPSTRQRRSTVRSFSPKYSLKSTRKSISN